MYYGGSVACRELRGDDAGGRYGECGDRDGEWVGGVGGGALGVLGGEGEGGEGERLSSGMVGV